MDGVSLTDRTVEFAIKYLKELQNGRVKPDKHQKHPLVRDSIDNAQSVSKMRGLLDNYFERKLNDG